MTLYSSHCDPLRYCLSGLGSWVLASGSEPRLSVNSLPYPFPHADRSGTLPSTACGRTALISAMVRDKLVELGIRQHEPFAICRAERREGNRRFVDWVVEPEGSAAPPQIVTAHDGAPCAGGNGRVVRLAGSASRAVRKTKRKREKDNLPVAGASVHQGCARSQPHVPSLTVSQAPLGQYW